MVAGFLDRNPQRTLELNGLTVLQVPFREPGAGLESESQVLIRNQQAQ